jgi:AbrB family looped-hinge helix DNA binding protein
MKSETKTGKFMGSVRVGPKGQIVIPKEVRDMFGISPGDLLMVLADSEKGLAIERYDTFSKIADAIFAGEAHELYPDQPEDKSRAFAEAIRKMSDKTDKKA